MRFMNEATRNRLVAFLSSARLRFSLLALLSIITLVCISLTFLRFEEQSYTDMRSKLIAELGNTNDELGKQLADYVLLARYPSLQLQQRSGEEMARPEREKKLQGYRSEVLRLKRLANDLAASIQAMDADPPLFQRLKAIVSQR